MSQSNNDKFFWRKAFREDSESLSSLPDEGSSLVPAETTLASDSVRRQQVSATLLRDHGVRSRTSSNQITESKLVIGIPVHNSEESLARVVVELRSLDADVVVCDDFSTDASEDIARALGCKLIKHPRTLGMSDSVTSLFLASRRLHSENLLIIDPDMDFNLRDVLNLLEKVQGGECDIAVGSGHLPDEESSDGDPFSLFRAYGKRALALITPAGTSSVVPESDIFEFAKQQGLKVREYPISSAIYGTSSSENARSPRNWINKIGSLVTQTESAISKTVKDVLLKHPLLFLGSPSIGMLVAGALQAIYTFQLWTATGVRPDYGFYYAGYDLVIGLTLGIGALILESLKNPEIPSRRKNI